MQLNVVRICKQFVNLSVVECHLVVVFPINIAKSSFNDNDSIPSSYTALVPETDYNVGCVRNISVYLAFISQLKSK